MLKVCDVPKLKKDEIYSNGELEYKVLGIKEIRKNRLSDEMQLVYEIRDNQYKYSYLVPCLVLENKNEELGYSKKIIL